MAGITWAPALPAPLGAPVCDDVPGRARISLGVGGTPGGTGGVDLRVDARFGPIGLFVIADEISGRAAGIAARNRALDVGFGVRGGGWLSHRVGIGLAGRVTAGRTWIDTGAVANLDDRWTGEIVPSLVVGERGEGPMLWVGPDVAVSRSRAVGLPDPARWRVHLGAEVGAMLWSGDLSGAAGGGSLWANVGVDARISRQSVVGASVGLGW